MNIVNEEGQPIAARLMRELSDVTKRFSDEEQKNLEAPELAEEIIKGHAGALAYSVMRCVPPDLWEEALASVTIFIAENIKANKDFHEFLAKRRKEKEGKQS